MKLIIGGIVLVTLVSPALANEYWVEYNYSTHVCSVVEKKAPEPAVGAAQGAAAADTTNANTTVAIAPNATTSEVTQGADAANTTTEGGAPRAPNAASDATQGTDAPNSTTEDRIRAWMAERKASGAPNAATPSGTPTSSGTPTTTSTGDNNFDPDNPFKALADSWARKKAAAEAAGTDTTKALIGTAMHSREEAESEMQVMRKCGLRP